MRGLFFTFLFIVSVFAALAGTIWPYWDINQAGFVQQILERMKPEETGLKARVWLGPGVETDATALVAGRMRVPSPPKAREPQNWFDGKTYDGCLTAFQQMEVKGESGEWVASGQPVAIEAQGGLFIGKWAIDPAFFGGAHAPKPEVKKLSDDMLAADDCPDGYDACRIVESCAVAGEYTVLGNRAKTPEGHWLVQLPNPSLIDYPLFQEQMQMPEEFSANYTRLIIKRISVSPWLGAAITFFCSLFMLLLSRREIEISWRLLLDPFRLLATVLKTNRSALDHATAWLVPVVPSLIVVAYFSLGKGRMFSACMPAYVLGYGVMLYGLTRRLSVRDLPPPEWDDDKAL